MKIKLIASGALASIMLASGLLAGCSSSGAETQSTTNETSSTQQAVPTTRTVTDSTGNKVTIPYEVTKVAPCIGAFAQVSEMLGEGKVVAAPVKQISDTFKKICSDYTTSNPNNNDTSSIESLIASGAQVAYGPASVFTDEQRAQIEAAGIAYVELSNVATVDGLCESILTIGEIMGDDEYARAQEFVEYYKSSMSEATSRVSSVAASDKKTVLDLGYSGGSFTTINKSDLCNEYMVAAGLTNVAADYSGTSSGNALTVDAEQIAAWNPDIIICTSQEATAAVNAEPALAATAAVSGGNVYTIPNGIYLWSVRSGEGALMTPWLGTIAYPNQFSDVNMEKEVRDFFSTWYRYNNLTDDEVEAILAGSTSAAAPR